MARKVAASVERCELVTYKSAYCSDAAVEASAHVGSKAAH